MTQKVANIICFQLIIIIFPAEDFCVNLFFSSPEISSEDTGHLCQSVLQDFSSVLSVDPASSNTSKTSLENGVASEENGGLEYDVTDDEDGVISSSLMVKLVVMAIVTVTRLQSKGRVVVGLCCVRSIMLCRVKSPFQTSKSQSNLNYGNHECHGV